MPATGIPNRASAFGSSLTSMASRPPRSQQPVAIGRYQLVKFLGEGSNAQVYLANDLKDRGRSVVVKRIKEHITQNPKFRQFFAAEVKSMVKFVHPYSVRLFDASLDDPLGPVLVMEHIHGSTLEDLMNRTGRFDVLRIARLLGPLCHALQSAHDAGIAHRDLKPANLMVTNVGLPQESLKVMDFGFASFAAKPHIQLSDITGHGSVFAVGTPAYVSPEMIRGDAVDGRADLYAVGVMLFELITGRLPFEHATVEQILAAHVKETPPRFHRIGSAHVDPGIEAVIQIALSKFPSERHQSARALALAFEQATAFKFWEETEPTKQATKNPPPPDSVVRIVDSADQTTNSPLTDNFTLHDEFEANLSERLAAAKLKGFAEDIGGDVMESEPGMIRMQLGMPKKPKTRSAIMNWISTMRTPGVERGKEPIELRLTFSRIDSSRVIVLACFTPFIDFMPTDIVLWRERCEAVYDLLRQYLMAAN